MPTSLKEPGRPRATQEIADLAVRMARENYAWGYDRLQGALANRGHIIAPNMVKNILMHGMEPAPERRKRISLKTFLKAYWNVMAATHFFTDEVWTSRGPATCYGLYITRLSTRSIHIAVVSTAPDGALMKQVARKLTDVIDGFLVNEAFLIMDRDSESNRA